MSFIEKKFFQIIVALLCFLFPLLFFSPVLLGLRGGIWRPSGLAGMSVKSMTIGVQVDEPIFYAAGSKGGVHRSLDGGATWMPANKGLPLGFWQGIV